MFNCFPPYIILHSDYDIVKIVAAVLKVELMRSLFFYSNYCMLALH